MRNSSAVSPEPVVAVRHLGKCYQIYDRPQDRLMQSLWRGRKTFYREFWALRDVSFEIARGETVGIVGRNGSGKSTLLQLICGTLTPTTGDIEVRGRVAALLELGAGFNPEFTGRENVHVGAAIAGLAPREIDARFDAIAAFADIGDFIDQPVKTYSSGMYVRLAFSVAINVAPDILVVDEALAVGDEAFQRKCFARLQDIQRRGGAILFVSHSASLVVELCDRALLVDAGEMLLTGSPKRVVSAYHKLIFAPADKAKALREQITALRAPAGASESQSSAAGPEAAASPEPARGIEYYDPGLVPKSTLAYESRGAVISDYHVATLAGERINVLVRGNEYIHAFRVDFTQPAFAVRFGTLIKTVSGFEIGGLLSCPIGETVEGLEYIEAGAVVRVNFKFRCDLLPGVYFFNAGVVGVVDGVEIFLHRIIDSTLFRVQPEAGLSIAGIADFSVPGSFEFEIESAGGVEPAQPGGAGGKSNSS